MINHKHNQTQPMKQPSFKIVNVYTGYAEFSVQSVDVIHAANISEAAVLAEENIQEALRDDGADDTYIQEFYTGFRKLCTGIYQVNNGEENVLLVIADSQPLFAQVDRSTTEWTNEQWAEWVKMLESDVVTA